MTDTNDIHFKEGHKGPNDRILFFRGKAITYTQLAELVIALGKIEDDNYIYGLGRYKLLLFLTECIIHNRITPDIKKRFKLE